MQFQTSALVQASGTAISGQVFEIEVIASSGQAVGTVNFQRGQDLDFRVENTLPDFCIEHGEPNPIGQSLLVNITVCHKGKLIPCSI